MAGRRNIEIIKGDDYSHVVLIKTRLTPTSTPTPVNITGRVYTSMLRKSKTQAVPDATFTCIVTDGAAGELTLYLANAITTALPAGCYEWDIQQSIAGIISTFLMGEAAVMYDVTR